jgi:hypothetical protein
MDLRIITDHLITTTELLATTIITTMDLHRFIHLTAHLLMQWLEDRHQPGLEDVGIDS